MNLYQPTISGSLTVSGSVVVDGTIVMSSGSISGTASLAQNSLLLNNLDSSSFVGTGSYNTFSGSVSSRLVTQENASGSFAAQSASLSTRVTNLEATSSTVSSSFASTSGSIAGRVNIIETSYATTGSNNFTKPQQISDVSNAISFTSTASLYTAGGLRVSKDSFVSGTAYFNNVVVYGTSSIQYITSSQVNIGTNIITVNTDTPAVRFGGLAVYDSGSTALTGSLLWDSQNNRWIYSNPSGSTYDGGMLISGPRNTTGLGNEVGTTACALMMGQGGDHITSSGIFSYGNATCFYGTTVISGSGNVAIGSDRLCSRLVVETNASPNLSGWITTGTQFASSMASGYASLNVGAYDNGSTCRYGWIRTAFSDNAAIPSDMVLLTGPSERVRIISTGITCFACQVCMPRLIVENGVGQASIFRQTDANSYSSLRLYNDQNNANRALEIDYYGSTYSSGERAEIFNTGAYPLLFGTSNVCRVSISSTGITSFACQICSAGLHVGGCTILGGTGNSQENPTRLGGTSVYNGVACYGSYGKLLFNANTNLTGGAYRYLLTNALDGNKFGFIRSPDANTDPSLGLSGAISSGSATMVFDGACVGIGTTSPNTTLEVRGSGNTAINSSGNLLVASGGTAAQAANQGGQISFGAWLNGDLSKPYPLAMIKGISECSTTNYNYGALLFGTMDSNTTVQERMRINSSGGVQISTNNVALVQKNAAGTGTIGLMRVGSDDKLQIGDGGTANPSVVYIPNGNVGIGCNNPQAKLDILRGSGDNLRFIGAGASDYSDMVFYATDNTTRLGYVDWSNTQSRYNVEANIPFVVYTNATERLRIAAAGQVTMACQPSFKAYISGPNPSGTKGAWNGIDYTATEWNVGGCFSTTTDRFTAPVTGKYLFTLQLNVYGLDDTATLQVAFYINSAAYRYYFYMQNLPTGNTGDTNVSVSDILLLSAGDTVQPRVYTDGSGTFNFSGGLSWNSFSGHLLG